MRRLSALIPILLLLQTTAYPTGFSPFDKGIAELVEAGEYEEAISKLKARLKSLKTPELIADTYFQIGDIYYKYLHDYPKALRTYRKVVELGNDNPSEEYVVLARMMEGEVLCRMGRHGEALDLYRRIAERYPSGTVYHAVAKQRWLSIRSALKVLDELKAKLAEFEGTPLAVQLRLQIAEIYRTDLNMPQEAIKEYRLILEKHPQNPAAPEALWWIGYLYSSMNMPRKAISAYREVVDRYPESKFDAEALFQMGRLYMKLGDYGKAAEAFERLIETRPAFWKLPAAFYWLGTCYELMGEYDRAIDSLRTFSVVYLAHEKRLIWAGDIGKHGETKLKIETEVAARIKQLELKLPESLWRIAEKELKNGRFDAAAFKLRKLISLFPDNPYAQKALAELKKVEMMGEVSRCMRIARSSPDPVKRNMARFRAAEIYENGLGDYEKAIREYEEVVRSGDEVWAARALYRIGMIYQRRLNDPKEAVKVFRRIVREYPKTEYAVMASYQLGELYRTKLNRHRDALVAYAEAISYPSQIRHLGDGFVDSLADTAAFRMGRVYFENLHDFEGARKVFEEFIRTYPRSPKLAAAYVFLGLIAEREGRIEDARKAYREALTRVLDSPLQAKMVKEEVAELNLGSDGQAEVARKLMERISSLKGR